MLHTSVFPILSVRFTRLNYVLPETENAAITSCYRLVGTIPILRGMKGPQFVAIGA